MKRTLLEDIPNWIPEDIRGFIGASPIYDSSCSREARVLFIDKDEGFFLKRSAKDTLAIEAKMTDYFYKKGLSAEVISYVSDDADYMLTRKVKGEDYLTRIILTIRNAFATCLPRGSDCFTRQTVRTAPLSTE